MIRRKEDNKEKTLLECLYEEEVEAQQAELKENLTR